VTARMGVSVGRLPQEVLLEEFYRNECSGTSQVGRVRAFEEFLTVFNCSVLTILECNKVPSRIEPEYVTNWCQKWDSRGKKKTLQLIIRHFNELRNDMCAGQEKRR
jgi:hypothetical protein